jgi:tetratricopeptide (TPR) repeat protein
MKWGIVAFLILSGCFKRPLSSPLPGLEYDGPDSVELDLLRASEGGSRILVQAGLPDGELGLFMIDTGADISVLSLKTAERLGLPIDEGWGTVEGLAGSSSLDRAVIPSLNLGEAIVHDIEVAVDPPGLQDRFGQMPFDGLLGNNVWAHFVVELDYPADTLILHRPFTMNLGAKAELLVVEEMHILTPIEITTAADPPHIETILIQVDTGAGDVLLSGSTGLPFEEDYSEGLEAVYGIGATEWLAPFRFQHVTRRIPLSKVELGGMKVPTDIEARWLNFDTKNPIGPKGMRGLAGHELLKNHVAFFDYQGHRFRLKKSQRRPRQLNGHAVLLEQDVERFGDDPSRYLFRAQLNTGMGEYDVAIDLIDKYLATHPNDAEARVLLAHLHRSKGELDLAWQAIKSVSAGELVDEEEIIASVNGFLLEDKAEQALALANKAVAARPDEGWAHVARADALFALDRLDESRTGLLLATKLIENPYGFLMRRARVAMATGDRYGSMAHIRQLLQLYPSNGEFLWFYSLLLEDEGDANTFRQDMQAAMARLHPSHKPLDFLAVSYEVLDDHETAIDHMEQGIERDCEGQMIDEASKDNCYAWYYSLARVRPDDALRRINRAIAEDGNRSDFLDTKAMVHLARKEYDLAYEAAVSAARLSPHMIYMLWQAERIGDIAASQ